MTYDFLTENEARNFWHSLLLSLGLDALIAMCSLHRVDVLDGSFYRVTVAE